MFFYSNFFVVGNVFGKMLMSCMIWFLRRVKLYIYMLKWLSFINKNILIFGVLDKVEVIFLVKIGEVMEVILLNRVFIVYNVILLWLLKYFMIKL